MDDLNPSFVGLDFIKEGPDWLAIFNPKVPRQMDVKLVNKFVHEKCVPCHVYPHLHISLLVFSVLTWRKIRVVCSVKFSVDTACGGLR